MRNEKKLGSAVIGLGVGVQHMLAILENSHCKLLRIVDIDKQKMEVVLNSHNLSKVKKSTYEDVLCDENIHLVSIASFDDDHYKQVMLALKAKKHVFVEKPMCRTVEELREIHEAFTKSGCGVASNLVLREAPLYKHIKDLILGGKFGQLYAFDGDYLYGRMHKITDGWRKDVNDYSVMQGGGIHMIDLMMWLTNEKPIYVVSSRNKIATKNSNFRYHDFHNAVFGFESGLVGRITANFGCVHPHQHVVRIFGTHATFIYDDQGARIHWNREEENKPEILIKNPKPTSKGGLIHRFVDHIRNQDLQSSAEREFDLMSVVLATDLSNEKQLNINYLSRKIS